MVKINRNTGFYRVNYDENNWNLIAKHLVSKKREEIHVLNRAQLINDALAFVENYKLKFNTLMSLMEHLKKERDYIAWYPGYMAFHWLRKKLTGTKYYSTFKVIKFLVFQINSFDHNYINFS